MINRRSAAKTKEARPGPTPAEPDYSVVVEYQKIELTRVLRENQNLRKDIDRIMRLLEREQVIRQQEQEDRAAMFAVVDRLTVERSLPPPAPETEARQVKQDEAPEEVLPPVTREEAPSDAESTHEIETSLSELREISERLEEVRARSPSKKAVEEVQEPPGGQDDEDFERPRDEELVAIIKLLDQINQTERQGKEPGVANAGGEADGPGQAAPAGVLRRALSRLAGVLERRS